MTAAIHVYGSDFFAADRSEWDPETLCEQRWDPERAVRRFEEANLIMLGNVAGARGQSSAFAGISGSGGEVAIATDDRPGRSGPNTNVAAGLAVMHNMFAIGCLSVGAHYAGFDGGALSRGCETVLQHDFGPAGLRRQIAPRQDAADHAVYAVAGEAAVERML